MRNDQHVTNVISKYNKWLDKGQKAAIKKRAGVLSMQNSVKRQEIQTQAYQGLKKTNDYLSSMGLASNLTKKPSSGVDEEARKMPEFRQQLQALRPGEQYALDKFGRAQANATIAAQQAAARRHSSTTVYKVIDPKTGTYLKDENGKDYTYTNQSSATAEQMTLNKEYDMNLGVQAVQQRIAAEKKANTLQGQAVNGVNLFNNAKNITLPSGTGLPGRTVTKRPLDSNVAKGIQATVTQATDRLKAEMAKTKLGYQPSGLGTADARAEKTQGIKIETAKIRVNSVIQYAADIGGISQESANSFMDQVNRGTADFDTLAPYLSERIGTCELNNAKANGALMNRQVVENIGDGVPTKAQAAFVAAYNRAVASDNMDDWTEVGKAYIEYSKETNDAQLNVAREICKEAIRTGIPANTALYAMQAFRAGDTQGFLDILNSGVQEKQIENVRTVAESYLAEGTMDDEAMAAVNERLEAGDVQGAVNALNAGVQETFNRQLKYAVMSQYAEALENPAIYKGEDATAWNHFETMFILASKTGTTENWQRAEEAYSELVTATMNAYMIPAKADAKEAVRLGLSQERADEALRLYSEGDTEGYLAILDETGFEDEPIGYVNAMEKEAWLKDTVGIDYPTYWKYKGKSDEDLMTVAAELAKADKEGNAAEITEIENVLTARNITNSTEKVKAYEAMGIEELVKEIDKLEAQAFPKGSYGTKFNESGTVAEATANKQAREDWCLAGYALTNLYQRQRVEKHAEYVEDPANKLRLTTDYDRIATEALASGGKVDGSVRYEDGRWYWEADTENARAMMDDDLAENLTIGGRNVVDRTTFGEYGWTNAQSSYYNAQVVERNDGQWVVYSTVLNDGTVMTPERAQAYGEQLKNGYDPDGMTLGVFDRDYVAEQYVSYAEYQTGAVNGSERPESYELEEIDGWEGKALSVYKMISDPRILWSGWGSYDTNAWIVKKGADTAAKEQLNREANESGKPGRTVTARKLDDTETEAAPETETNTQEPEKLSKIAYDAYKRGWTPDANGQYEAEAKGMGGDAISTAYNWYTYATDEEKKMLAYLASSDPKAAGEYLKKVDTYVNERAMNDLSGLAQKVSGAEIRDENGNVISSANHWLILASKASTFLTKPLDAAGGLYTLWSTITGEEMDPYSKWFVSQTWNSTIRNTQYEAIQAQFDEKYGKEAGKSMLGKATVFAIQTIDSCIDSWISATLGQGIAAGKVGEAFSLATMGFSAAGETTKEMLEKGVPQKQAKALGMMAGCFEALFEVVSLDKIVHGADDLTQSWIKRVTLGAGVEGSEEIFTEVANIAANSWILGNAGDYNTEVAQMMTNGASYANAAAHATMSKAIDVLVAGAGGFLSGGMSGTVNAAKAHVATKETGASIRAAGGARGIVEAAVTSTNETVQAMWDKIKVGYETNRNISDLDLGRLNYALAKSDMDTMTKKVDELEEAGEISKYEAKQMREYIETTYTASEMGMASTAYGLDMDPSKLEGVSAEAIAKVSAAAFEITDERRTHLETIMDEEGVSEVIGKAKTEIETATIKAEDAKAMTEENVVKTEEVNGVTYVQHTQNKLGAVQKMQLKFAAAMARVSGTQIVVHDTLGANGVTIDGVLHVAMDSDRGFVSTVAHEMTHWLKTQAGDESYNKLANFLMSEANRAKKGGYEALVEKKAEAVRKSYPTADEQTVKAIANEEAVAELCETMLSDETFVRELAQQDMNLAEKIFSWINDMLNGFRKLMSADKEVRGIKEAERYVQDMEKARDLWYACLQDAKNGKKVEADTDARFSTRNVTTENDQAYMNAVESGDMKTAKNIVDETIKKNGMIRAYHGTKTFGFTEFEGTRSGEYYDEAIYLTDSESVAKSYSGVEGTTEVKNGDEYVNVDKLNDEELIDFFKKYAMGKAEGWTKAADARIKTYPNGNKVVQVATSYPNGAKYWTDFSGVEGFRSEMKSVPQKSGNYDLAFYPGKMMEIDCSGNNDGHLKIPEELKQFDYERRTRDVTTNYIAQMAKEAGYDSVAFHNIRDYWISDGVHIDGEPKTTYAIFDNRRIKSADAVTYDDGGNVIPPSQRFNDERTDIRFSQRETQTGMTQTEEEERTTMEPKATGTIGNNVPVYDLRKKAETDLKTAEAAETDAVKEYGAGSEEAEAAAKKADAAYEELQRIREEERKDREYEEFLSTQATDEEVAEATAFPFGENAEQKTASEEQQTENETLPQDEEWTEKTDNRTAEEIEEDLRYDAERKEAADKALDERVEANDRKRTEQVEAERENVRKRRDENRWTDKDRAEQDRKVEKLKKNVAYIEGKLETETDEKKRKALGYRLRNAQDDLARAMRTRERMNRDGREAPNKTDLGTADLDAAAAMIEEKERTVTDEDGAPVIGEDGKEQKTRVPEVIEQILAGVKRVATWSMKAPEKMIDALAGADKALKETLNNLIQRPLNEASSRYTTNYLKRKAQFDGAMKMLGIVTDKTKAGIERTAKLSAAIQKYGEGFYYNEQGERITYTLDDLKKDFPDDWESVVRAEQYCRDMYDDYHDMYNAMLEKIYPNVIEHAETDAKKLKAMVDKEQAKLDNEVKLVAELEAKLALKQEELARKKSGTQAYANLENSIENLKYRLENSEHLVTMYKGRVQMRTQQMEEIIKGIETGDLVRNRRLQRRNDYYHHFTQAQEGFARLRQILTEEEADIDPMLVGKTDSTNPRSGYAGFAQKRLGEKTEYDAIKGMHLYMQQIEKRLAYDPVANHYKNLIDELRKNGNAGLSADGKQVKEANDLIRWLEEERNQIVGKSSMVDRKISDWGIAPRKAVQALKWLNSRVKANRVLGNLHSAAVQASNLTNAMLYVNDIGDWGKAFWNTMVQLCSRGSAGQTLKDIMSQSEFMTQRYGLEDLEYDETKWNPKQVATKLMGVMDEAAGHAMWWAAYHQYNAAEEAKRNGKKNRGIADTGREYRNAIEYADDIARRSTAGRGIGELAPMMTSSVVGMLSPFQIEVNNTFQNVKDAIGKKNWKGLVGFAAATWAMNALGEMIFGDRSLPFDIIDAMVTAIEGGFDDDDDDEEDRSVIDRVGKTVKLFGQNTASTIMNGIPMMSLLNMFGGEKIQEMFGIDLGQSSSGTLGASAVADAVSGAIDFTSKVMNGKVNSLDEAWTLALQDSDWMNVLLPWGGTQLQRTLKGADAAFRGYSQKMNSEGELEAQFPIEGFFNGLRAATFGKWSTPEGKAFLNGETKGLNAETTVMMKEAKDAGMTPTDFFTNLASLKKVGAVKDEAGNTVVTKSAAQLAELSADETMTGEQKQILLDSLGKNFAMRDRYNADETGIGIDTFLSYAADYGDKTDLGEDETQRSAFLSRIAADRTMTDAQKIAMTGIVLGASGDTVVEKMRRAADAGISVESWIGIDSAGTKQSEKLAAAMGNRSLNGKQLITAAEILLGESGEKKVSKLKAADEAGLDVRKVLEIEQMEGGQEVKLNAIAADTTLTDAQVVKTAEILLGEEGAQKTGVLKAASEAGLNVRTVLGIDRMEGGQEVKLDALMADETMTPEQKSKTASILYPEAKARDYTSKAWYELSKMGESRYAAAKTAEQKGVPAEKAMEYYGVYNAAKGDDKKSATLDKVMADKSLTSKQKEAVERMLYPNASNVRDYSSNDWYYLSSTTNGTEGTAYKRAKLAGKYGISVSVCVRETKEYNRRKAAGQGSGKNGKMTNKDTKKICESLGLSSKDAQILYRIYIGKIKE